MNPIALIIGLAGGIASALLIAAMAGGPLGVPLFFVAPLPIAIVVLGWGTMAGIVATVAAALGLGLAISPQAGLVHLAMIGFPSALYGHLLGLARPHAEGDTLEWYPVARIFLFLVGITGLSMIAAGIIGAFDVNALALEMRDMLVAYAKDAGETDLPDSDTLLVAVRFYVRLMPLAFAPVWLVNMAGNVWLALKIVRKSERLHRPTERFSEALALPSWPALLFVVLLWLSTQDNGLGLAAGALAGSIGMGYTIIGFCILHIYARLTAGGSILLAFTYALTFFITLPLIPLAIAGALDGPLGIRRKALEKLAGKPPKPV